MKPPGGFTEVVRQELARLPLPGLEQAKMELGAIAALRGSIIVSRTDDGRISRQGGMLEVVSFSGAVARRVHALLSYAFDAAPQLMVRSGAGVGGHTSFGIRCAITGDLRATLGLDNGPLSTRTVVDGCTDRVGWLRATLLCATSISAPGRPAHLEMRVESKALVGVAREHLIAATGVEPVVLEPTASTDLYRVVVKSGEAIGDLLALTGASSAFLVWDDRRLRRQLRNEANRLANADTANVRRSVQAATRQIRQIEEVIERLGWEVLGDEDRETALARLANPAASLAELGQLVDPPVSKATVARRLQRVVALAGSRE
ncbi:MAG: DNA-binding protein WhiA [Nitriliruptoraceae bacterium]